MSKSLAIRLIYAARNFSSRAVFGHLAETPLGRVLDVGGWDFVDSALSRGARFEDWLVLDSSNDRIQDVRSSGRVHLVRGDGCAAPFVDESFDTVLNLQVLEHVFDPMSMVLEIARILRPGGRAILLLPQTSTLHLAPHHYYNFTRYWIVEAMGRAGLEILALRPLGGFWRTIASRLVYFFLQSARFAGMSSKECVRTRWFYLLFPAMVAVAIVGIPIALLLSLGDLTEEPNNHLVVVRRPPGGLGSSRSA